MSKDLSKEYKEAVMNDLPDLWDRIEAAIDADEKENSQPVIKEETKPEVLVFPEKKATENTENNSSLNKKKKRIPGWVWVSIPSAAILVLVMIPVGLMALNGSLASSGTKNSTTCDTAVAPNSDSASYSYDYAEEAATTSVAEYEDSVDSASDDMNYKTENDTVSFTQDEVGLTTNSDSEINADYIWDAGDLKGIIGSEAPGASEITGAENLMTANSCLAVKILYVYENEEGTPIAEVYVTEVIGENNSGIEGFDGFKEDETFTAYIPDGFSEGADTVFETAVIYIPDNDIHFIIGLPESD